MNEIVNDWDEYKRTQAAVATGVTTPIQEHAEALYTQGWNAALEYAAMRLMNEHLQSFGTDTTHSFAVYIKGMKR